jgi:hypothetical protein
LSSFNQNAILDHVMLSTLLNPFILRNLKILEMTGVLMRIGRAMSWLH